MSIEGYPSQSNDIIDLINQCEQAIKEDDPFNDSDIYDFYDLPCARLCEVIRQEFERKYQLVYHEDSIYGFGDEFKNPYEYSRIVLDNPSIFIPSVLPNGKSLELKISSGAIEVPYLGIALHSSDVMDDGEIYTGPHLFGKFNTKNADIDGLKDILPAGEYTFISPLKTLEVSEKHIPHLMN